MERRYGAEGDVMMPAERCKVRGDNKRRGETVNRLRERERDGEQEA